MKIINPKNKIESQSVIYNNQALDTVIQELHEKINGTVLYENSQGVSSGSFVLNDNVQNYKRHRFFDENGSFVGEIETPDVGQTFGVMLSDQGSTSTYFRIARLQLTSLNEITFINNKRTYWNGSAIAQDNTGLAIGKVIGYK